MNLNPERISDFIDKLNEEGIKYEHDLYNVSNTKLRSWGISDAFIRHIRKTIDELAVVRRIMHGESGQSTGPSAKQVHDSGSDAVNSGTVLDLDESFDEDMWDCHGQGK